MTERERERETERERAWQTPAAAAVQSSSAELQRLSYWLHLSLQTPHHKHTTTSPVTFSVHLLCIRHVNFVTLTCDFWTQQVVIIWQYFRQAGGLYDFVIWTGYFWHWHLTLNWHWKLCLLYLEPKQHISLWVIALLYYKYWQIDRQTVSQSDWQTQTDRQSVRQTDSQSDRETDRV